MASDYSVPWLTYSGGKAHEIHDASAQLCGYSSALVIRFLTAEKFDYAGPEWYLKTQVEATHDGLSVRVHQWLRETEVWNFRSQLSELAGPVPGHANLAWDRNDVLDAYHSWKLAISADGALNELWQCEVEMGIPDLHAEVERVRRGPQGNVIRETEYSRTKLFCRCSLGQLVNFGQLLDDLYRCLEPLRNA